jgi:DNA-binding CsgD family transcriptional regulator/GAF domain-containing protein
MDAATIDRDYDELIGLVYQGALQQRPFESFLPRLRDLLDVQLASLTLRPPTVGDHGVILNSLRPDAAGKQAEAALANQDDWQLIAYREQFYALDPFVNLPPGQVVTLSDLMPEAELLDSDYYKHYLQPIELFHLLGVDTLEPDGMLARLRLARRRSEAPFDDNDRTLLALVTPHLQRAIQIHAQLNRTASERDLYAGAVEQLSVASIILDEQARVLNSNALADTLLDDGDVLRLRGQRLRIVGRDLNQQLQAAISAITAAQIRGETGLVKALRIPRPAGRSDLGLVLRPIPAPEWTEGQSSPCVAVFISDPDLRESASQQILGELFKLSPAEANLAILLSRGLSLAEVSEAQNVSQHTARAQLKSIFAKTGVSRQAELVRLILKSVASLG